MKKFLIKSIVFQTVFILNCFAQTTGWEVVKSNTNKNLNSIFFYDYQTGFACGDSGVVLKSVDSGKTWQSLQSPLTANLNDCFMFAKDCLTAVGDSATLIDTNDGGNNWFSDQIQDLVGDIYSFSFYPENQHIYYGIYSADSREIMFGTSTYCSEIIVDTLTSGAGGFYASYMLNTNVAFVAGDNSISQPTVGRTHSWPYGWEYISFYFDGNEGRATGVAFTDSLVGYISAKVWDGRGAVAKTANSGYDWTTTFFSNSLNSINFPKGVINRVGYCVGDSGTILKTLDDGESWYQQVSGTNENLNKVFFLDSDFGFAVGNNGIILRTTTGGGPVTNINTGNGNLVEFNLQQNYPNPFNPVTKIKYNVPSMETNCDASLHITLKVYDVLGNEVATLVDEEKPAGEYEVEFDGNNLPSGIYFYQLKSGSFISVKKMVLLK